MDRPELADFLRKRREQIKPGDVGLPLRARRRTEGLRRDEVAALADISTDYYTRLEQARGPHPSTAVLTGIARALRLSNDERDHLFLLADQAVPAHAGRRDDHVGPGLLHLLDHLDDCPAFICADSGETLMQNDLSRFLMGDVGARPADRRNFLVHWFLHPAESRRSAPPEDQAVHSRSHVDDLRAVAAQHRDDPEIAALVHRLREGSEEFERLWAAHNVAVRRSNLKRLIHPEVGLIDMRCEILLSAMSTRQRLVVLYPTPGTDAREKLDLLRVIGSQQLTL